jgi:hypothetical protein
MGFSKIKETKEHVKFKKPSGRKENGDEKK